VGLVVWAKLRLMLFVYLHVELLGLTQLFLDVLAPFRVLLGVSNGAAVRCWVKRKVLPQNDARVRSVNLPTDGPRICAAQLVEGESRDQKLHTHSRVSLLLHR